MKDLLGDLWRTLCYIIYYILWFLFFVAFLGFSIISLLYFIGRDAPMQLRKSDVLVLVVGFVIWILLVYLFGKWRKAPLSDLTAHLSKLSLQELIVLFKGDIYVEDTQRIYKKNRIGFRSLDGFFLVDPDEAYHSGNYKCFRTADFKHVLIYKSQVEDEKKIREKIKQIIANRREEQKENSFQG